MNILIINQPPFNRGDESAHKGLLRTLLKRLPEARIRVLTKLTWIESVRQFSVHDKRIEYIYDPEPSMLYGKFYALGMIYGITSSWNYNPTFRKYKKIYDWADIVVCAPGGICMGGFQDWDHLFHLKLAKWRKKTLVYYGRSFGPFPQVTELNRKFRSISIEMLKYFKFLSIRDQKTELLAREMGFEYIKTVDSAFLDDPNVDIPYEIRVSIANKKYMVFVPNYLRWHFNYKNVSHETIINFYCKVIAEVWRNNPDMNILMLPQTFCEDRYEFDDISMFREVADKIGDDRIIIISNSYSSDVQQMLIRNAHYVIGGRYHSIVFAINQDTPCIALSYEHKISGLLDTLEKQEWCVNFENVFDSIDTQEQCIAQISNIIPNLKTDHALKVKAKQLVNACMDSFIQFINNKL